MVGPSLWVGVAALLASMAGCGSSTSESGPTPSSASQPATSSTSEPSPRDPDPASLLQRLVIGDDDLRPGERTDIIDGGTDADFEVTLDYCGAAFPSEGHRVARRQQGIADDTNPNIASNEAVLYEPDYAEQALAEIERAVAECPPDKLAESDVVGTPALRTSSRPIPEDQLTSVVADHLAIVETATPENGPELTLAAIFQRRGRVLIISYSPDPARAVALANSAGKRLADSPAEELGA